MKINIGLYKYSVFICFIVSLLFNGVVSEVCTWLCIFLFILTTKRYNKRLIGFKLYKVALRLIILFSCLFIFQLFYMEHNDDFNVIRLFGLTKCICAPAICLLCLTDIGRSNFSLLILMMMLFVFNTIYFVCGLFTDVDSVSFDQLGSFNGCSGVNMVLVPAVFFFANTFHGKNAVIVKLLSFIYLISVLLIVFISDSTTTQILLFIQIFMVFFFPSRQKKILFKNVRRVCLIILGGLFLITILIANKSIPLDPEALKTRVAIWSRAYNVFFEQDSQFILFGSGDDIVQMLSKALPPHNMFIEVLLIYGIVGLFCLLLGLVVIGKCILFSRNSMSYLIISLLTYFLICFLHPFYTGLFLFQCISMLSFIFIMYNHTTYKTRLMIATDEQRQ